MAACFHLRSVKVFSFLLVLLCFSYGFEFGIASGQPSDGYSYEWLSHSRSSLFSILDGFKFLYEIRRNPGQTTYFFVLKIKIATTMENM